MAVLFYTNRAGEMIMKKVLLITGVMLMCVSASAATKCVPAVASSCRGTLYKGSVDWDASCTLAGADVTLYGVAGCSNMNKTDENGGQVERLTTAESTADNPTSNIYCWCRIIRPAVSDWVFAANEGNVASCEAFCAYHCANYLTHYLSFRGQILGAMKY